MHQSEKMIKEVSGIKNQKENIDDNVLKSLNFME